MAFCAIIDEFFHRRAGFFRTRGKRRLGDFCGYFCKIVVLYAFLCLVYKGNPPNGDTLLEIYYSGFFPQQSRARCVNYTGTRICKARPGLGPLPIGLAGPRPLGPGAAGTFIY
jgi:hypothetical protein